MSGWIKLHRKILKSAVFENEKALKVWVWCLLRANHTEREVMMGHQVVKVNPGEFITGSKKSAQELEMPETTVRRYLKTLESCAMIERKVARKWTVIKVVNWGNYQGNGHVNGAITERKRSDNGAITETDKNVKNEKNEKNKDIASIWEHYLSTFDGIYQPRKLTKTRKSHIRRRLETYSVAEIKKAIDNIRQSDWHIGRNPDGKVYATPDFIFKNDETVEKWLNYTPEQHTEELKRL